MLSGYTIRWNSSPNTNFLTKSYNDQLWHKTICLIFGHGYCHEIGVYVLRNGYGNNVCGGNDMVADIKGVDG